MKGTFRRRSDELGYRSSDLIQQLDHISYRMLHLWMSKKLVAPSNGTPKGSGTWAYWSEDDLARLRIIDRLCLAYPAYQIPTAAVAGVWRLLVECPTAANRRWLIIRPDGNAAGIDDLSRLTGIAVVVPMREEMVA